MMERNPWFRALIILAVIAVGLYVADQLWTLIVHFGDIIILFFLAWLLAFILLPVVRFIDARLPVGLVGAAAIVYVSLLFVFVAILVLVVPLLLAQVSQLSNQLTTLAVGAPDKMLEIQETLDRNHIRINLADLGVASGPSLSQQLGQFGSSLVENTVSVASGIASGVFNFTIVMILSFYFVVDGDRIVRTMLSAVPEPYADDAQRFVISIDRTFGGFLRGTAIQAAILGVGTGIIMAISGLGYVLLVGIFAAVVMVIPFIGPLLAMVLPIIVALFSSMATTQLLIFLIALIALQILVMNVIAPKVLSDSVGLHPLLVFLALLVGIKQAGLAGAVFGVPIVAVIVATIRIFLNRWSVIQIDPTAPHSNGVVGPHPVRFEELRLHVNNVITRIFHSKVP